MNLEGVIPSRHSFLIGLTLKISPAARLQLSDFDMEWANQQAFPNKNVKVVLLDNIDLLDVVNPFDTDGEGTKTEGYVDMLAVAGNDAADSIDGYETAYLSEQSKQKAIRRKGFQDTDNNALDVEAIDYRDNNSFPVDIGPYIPHNVSYGAWCGRINVDLNFSFASGVYEKPINLRVQNKFFNPQIEIYYTTDGSIPDINSARYDENGIKLYGGETEAGNFDLLNLVNSDVAVDGANLLKGVSLTFMAFAEGKPVGEPVYRTYMFAQKERYEKTSIMFMTGEKSELLDLHANSYNTDLSYFFNYEYLEWNESEQTYATVFNNVGSTKIIGAMSRGLPQKTFSVNLDKSPYDANITEPVFDHADSFKRFRLWDGGNAWYGDQFRDAFVQRMAGDTGLNVPYTDYKVCVVFINGEYWGVYLMREHYDKDYAVTQLGVTNADNFVQITTSYMWDADSELLRFFAEVDDGDEETAWAHYEAFCDYITNADFSDAATYQELITTWIDEDNIIDYLIVNLFFGNNDWPHNNVRMWYDTQGKDQKWRFMLHDLDFAGLFSPAEDTFSVIFNHYPYEFSPEFMPLFEKLFDNAGFRQKFLTRAVSLISDYFTPENMLELYNNMAGQITPLMREHFARFDIDKCGIEENLATYQASLQQMRDFITVRATYFLDFVYLHCDNIPYVY